MIKFGVTSRKRAETILPREQAHAGWWPYAFTLLEDLDQSYTEADEPLVERIYQGLAAGADVWKITKADRFLELDEQVGLEIDERFGADRPLVVHDMAVSNGVTSLQWYDRLCASRTVTFYASDYFDRLTLVTPPGTGWTVVFDVEDRPLQCVSRRFVITCLRDELRRHPINRVIQQRLRRSVIPAAVRQLAEARRHGQGLTHVDGVRELLLYHPRCQQRANTDAFFHLQRHDLFTPDAHHCDAVRVMNALTPHHFSESQLVASVRQSIDNMLVGGLFVVGRSIDEEDGRTAASVFERTESGLHRLWDLNEGSEIKGLIDSITTFSQAIAS